MASSRGGPEDRRSRPNAGDDAVAVGVRECERGGCQDSHKERGCDTNTRTKPAKPAAARCLTRGRAGFGRRGGRGFRMRGAAAGASSAAGAGANSAAGAGPAQYRRDRRLRVRRVRLRRNWGAAGSTASIRSFAPARVDHSADFAAAGRRQVDCLGRPRARVRIAPPDRRSGLGLGTGLWWLARLVCRRRRRMGRWLRLSLPLLVPQAYDVDGWRL